MKDKFKKKGVFKEVSVMLEVVPIIITVVFSFVNKNVFGSTGDRSQMFYTCVQDCLAKNCSGKMKMFAVCVCFIELSFSNINFKITRFSTRFSVVFSLKTNAVDML